MKCSWIAALLVPSLSLLQAMASHMDLLTWEQPSAQRRSRRYDPRETDPSVRDCSDPNNLYLPPTTVDTASRLAALRDEMEKSGFDAYIVPSEDEHLSEYIAPRYKRRQWISGFSGSQGTAVITKTDAAMWADGRYFIQAEREMDCNWMLMKSGEPGTPSIQEWIVQTLSESSSVGANPFVFSIGWWKYYKQALQEGAISFNQSLPDLVDVVWDDRPGPSGTEIIVFPLQYAGQDWKDKVADARKVMKDNGADFLLLTRLDEIAWLFNLRGTDIPYTPVFTSYALVGLEEIRLYLNLSHVQCQDVKDHLQPLGCDVCVELRDYAEARDDVLQLSGEPKVWMSSASTTYGMYSALPEENQIQDESPIKVPKSVKNDIQQEAMKRAHVYDAIALSEYFIWLEENVVKGLVDEVSGAEKLEMFRWSQAESRGPSFGSISASGPNAALIHYSTSEETNRNLTTEEIYLIDSGGHYFEGTTDTTRTLHFGTPTDFQKETFTRVLMGVIDVETAIFPSTVDGNDIGILARRHLYDVGLDYRHGSGHGIGQYLCIHEYPPGVGTSGAEGYPFQVGMFTSIEPGYYEGGEFGIRHENVIMVKRASTEYSFGEYPYLTFESVTLVPFQRKMIDETLLSDDQLEYLNEYHAKVLEVVGAEAKNQEKDYVYQWLESATQPIVRNSATSLNFPFSFQFVAIQAVAIFLLNSV